MFLIISYTPDYNKENLGNSSAFPLKMDTMLCASFTQMLHLSVCDVDGQLRG